MQAIAKRDRAPTAPIRPTRISGRSLPIHQLSDPGLQRQMDELSEQVATKA